MAPATRRSSVFLDPTDRRAWRVHPVYLLTLVGAILRLCFITRPTLWNDETLTHSRVCGSFRDLLDVLQRDGFAPLHYELYWLIARRYWLEPDVMRWVPAVAGILMVPAIYFLARQIVRERAAVLTAGFTAVSAYMLVYARDAKMYMHFWLFAVLCVACFLAWLRTGRRWAWLAWVASGLAMVGLHTLGLMVIGLLPMMLITGPRPHWKKGLLALIGIVIVLSGPAGYYLKFNRLIQRSEDQNFEDASGTRWVKLYNEGRTGPDLALEAATAYLYAWEWPRESVQDSIDPETLRWLKITGVALLAVTALGALPWRRFRPIPRDTGLQPVPATPERQGLIDPPSPPSPHLASMGCKPVSRGEQDEPQPWWRAVLWLSAWLVVPAYVYYCKSITGFVSPTDWATSVGDLVHHRWLALALTGTAVAIPMSLWRRTGPLAAIAIIAVAVILLNVIGLPWYASPLERFTAAAIAVGAAACWTACATTYVGRGVRSLQLAAIVAGVLGTCVVIHGAIKQQPEGSIWVPRYLAVIWPAFAVALAALVVRLPARSLQWAVVAVLVIVNLDRFAERLFAGTEPPIDRMARDVLASDAPRKQYRPDGSIITWHEPSTTRVYIENTPFAIPHPGYGTIQGATGKYFMSIYGLDVYPPKVIRPERGGNLYGFHPFTNPSSIVSDVKGSPKLTRIVVWDRLQPGALSRADDLLPLLGKGWTLVPEEVGTPALSEVRLHWDWEDLGTARRREYVRTVVR